MRNDVINHITLDLGRQLANKSVSVKKNDTKTRTLHFTLMSEGEIYTLENILLATIRGKKPDGTMFYNDCVIDGNEVQYEVTSQTIAATGEVVCELVLMDRDNAELCSSQFTIVVYDCIFDDSVLESGNEYAGLKKILNICGESESKCLSTEERVKELLEKALNAQKSAEECRNLAEEYKKACLEAIKFAEKQADTIYKKIEKNAQDISEIASPDYETPNKRENLSPGESLFLALGKIRRFFSDLKTVAFSGKYSDLTGTPDIPERVSDLENDEGFVTASGTVEKANKATILANARTFITNLASTSTASFNGSGNVSPGVKGILPISNGGTGNTDGKAADSSKLEGHSASYFAGANHSHSDYASKDHSHNYDDLTGTPTIPENVSDLENDAGYITPSDTVEKANTASKLGNARTFITNLASTSAASFDGTANVSPGVKGILPIGKGGTGNTTGKAADSAKLDGHSADYFATADHTHSDGTGNMTGKAADSEKLGGHSADYFAPANHTHSDYASEGHTHNYDDLTGRPDIPGKVSELENDAGFITNNDIASKADKNSPILTGTPKAPTAAAGTNTTQIATTAFAKTAVSSHNTSSSAHSDLRDLITALTSRLNALADSDDTTLDQLSEIVDYIKSNRSLIEGVTTNKVNVSDIINNLTSTVTNKPLSAKQGKILNDLIATLSDEVANITPEDIGAAPYAIVENGDFNDMTTPGLYTMKGGKTNAPTTGSYHSLIVLRSDSGAYVQQIAVQESTTDVYVRYCLNSIWGNWVKLMVAGDTATNSANLGGYAPSYFAPSTHSHSYDDLEDRWEIQSVTVDPNFYTDISYSSGVYMALYGISVTLDSFDELVVMSADAIYTSLAGWSYSGTTLSLEFLRLPAFAENPVTVYFMTR